MPSTDEDFKKRLTPEQYRVMREKGTEAPFTGKYFNHNESGLYSCAACGAELFNSGSKYDSNIAGLAGWPSFYDVAKAGAVELCDDNSFGMKRVEVVCANCGSHLGHLFDDHTSPNGQHYCINSVALEFLKEKEENSRNKEKK